MSSRLLSKEFECPFCDQKEHKMMKIGVMSIYKCLIWRAFVTDDKLSLY